MIFYAARVYVMKVDVLLNNSSEEFEQVAENNLNSSEELKYVVENNLHSKQIVNVLMPLVSFWCLYYKV